MKINFFSFLFMLFLQFSFVPSYATEAEEVPDSITPTESHPIKAIYDNINDTLEWGVINCAQTLRIDKIVQKQMLPGTWCFTEDGSCTFVGGEKVKLPCLDGMLLDGEYIEKYKKGPTVVLFHGNGNSYEGWHGLNYFTDHNYNVLAFSIRGYGNSGGTRDEIAYSSALDVEAALRFLIQEKEIPQDKIVTYGISLGGGYATYAARYFGIPAILDKTFTRIGDVIEGQIFLLPSALMAFSSIISINGVTIEDMIGSSLSTGLEYLTYGNLLYYGLDYILPVRLKSAVIPSFLKNGIAKSFLTKERKPEINDLGLFQKYGNIPPNSFDNIFNLENTSPQVPVLILYGSSDFLMGAQRRALELYAAAPQQNGLITDRLVELLGGHNDTVGFCSSVGKKKIESFLETVFKTEQR